MGVRVCADGLDGRVSVGVRGGEKGVSGWLERGVQACVTSKNKLQRCPCVTRTRTQGPHACLLHA